MAVAPILLASFYTELGRPEEAILVLDESLKRDQGAVGVSDIAARMLCKAWIEQSAGRSGDAVLTLQAALARSDSADTRFNAGLLYARLGHISEAERLKGTFNPAHRFQINAVAPHRLAGNCIGTWSLQAGLQQFRGRGRPRTARTSQRALARAYAKAGRWGRSMALYDSMLSRPGRICRYLDQEAPGLWMDSTLQHACVAAEAGSIEAARKSVGRYRAVRGNKTTVLTDQLAQRRAEELIQSDTERLR